MAKGKTPPRYKSGPKKGQFMPKRARAARKGGRKSSSTRTRKNPGRTVARKTTASPKRRTAAKRNPPRRKFDPVRSLVEGGTEAAQVLIGKSLARSVPDLVGMPKQGNIGLAIQAGVALATGYAAEMFVSPQAARALMAGGLTAPLETLVVAQNIPWMSRALSPTTAQGELGAYVMGGNGRALSSGRRAASTVGRYVENENRGLAAYPTGGRAA